MLIRALYRAKNFISDHDMPSAIEFWDYCRSLHELASDHGIRVRNILARYDFIEDDWDEKKAEEQFSRSVALLSSQFESLSEFRGFPEFGDLNFMYEIVARMSSQLKRVVIHRDLNYGMFGDHEDNWGNLNFELHQSINHCAQNHPEIHQVAYQRAIIGLEATEPKLRSDIQPESLPRLSKNKQTALEIIKNDGPIVGKLIAKKVGIEESTFHTHYVQQLKLYGVKNDDDGEGYYYLKKPDN